MMIQNTMVPKSIRGSTDPVSFCAQRRVTSGHDNFSDASA